MHLQDLWWSYHRAGLCGISHKVNLQWSLLLNHHCLGGGGKAEGRETAGTHIEQSTNVGASVEILQFLWSIMANT